MLVVNRAALAKLQSLAVWLRQVVTFGPANSCTVVLQADVSSILMRLLMATSPPKLTSNSMNMSSRAYPRHPRSDWTAN